jgi:hypothetical protein
VDKHLIRDEYSLDMPYLLYRRLTENSALLQQESHFDFDLESGKDLPTGCPEPVEFTIDTTSMGREMSLLFVMPAFLVKRDLFKFLTQAGVKNIFAYAAVIRNEETGERWDDYVFVNVIGLNACADLANSDYSEIGNSKVIDQLAIKAGQVPSVDIFRLLEDPLSIVVSDRIYHRLTSSGFTDIHFEPVTIV